jgi:hypothetical protein
MKNLLIISMLFACSIVMGQTSNSAAIIGNPIRKGNILIAQKDFPQKMNWSVASSACAGLGDGWRLPTKDELMKQLYNNRLKIGGFAHDAYWSSTEAELDSNVAWFQDFFGGKQNAVLKNNATFSVRAVKSL